jgi:hypothetical protein
LIIHFGEAKNRWKLTFKAHKSRQDASQKIFVFKAVANFENISIEFRVEIMKVLIVLVLLVAFARCEETTQELEKDYECYICVVGVQFARDHIDMDFDVIWLDFADSRSKWPLKFLCISRNSQRRSKRNTAAPYSTCSTDGLAETVSTIMENSSSIKLRRENLTKKFVKGLRFASQVLYRKCFSENLTVLNESKKLNK